MSHEPAKAGAKQGDQKQPAIHRVCIQCNNMFRVTMENFEAKQCPNCHKG